eukprot:114317-Hanusia_phi.AAC.2
MELKGVPCQRSVRRVVPVDAWQELGTCDAMMGQNSTGVRWDAVGSLCILFSSTSERREDMVLHNLEVCQGYKVSFANPKELLAKLQSIKADVDQKRNEGSENEDFAFDDVDTAILNSNIAVLALQLRKYATATQALDRLFRSQRFPTIGTLNIEPLDELLAARICVMLLDSLSVQRLPEKAVQVLNFLEKTIQALFVSKASSDSTNESQDANPAASAEFQKYGFVSLPQLKILLSIYKAKHYLFHGNAKAAKREIKAAIAGSQPAELASPLMLKAHLEYLRGNFRKAQKLLCSSSLSDQPFRSFQLNNMGCLHYRSRKYGIAAMYFRRSIQELSKSNEQTERAKMEAISCVKREEVLYNLGLQNLLLGRGGVLLPTRGLPSVVQSSEALDPLV